MKNTRGSGARAATNAVVGVETRSMNDDHPRRQSYRDDLVGAIAYPLGEDSQPKCRFANARPEPDFR